jgi:hypothetical protein
MGNYTKYRYYKGENENPFNSYIDSASSILWQAEYVLTLLISKRIFCPLASLTITEWAINLWICFQKMIRNI